MPKNYHFINEFINKPVCGLPEVMSKYIPLIHAHFNGQVIDIKELPPLKLGAFDHQGRWIPEFTPEQKTDSVAVIPINGVMSKGGDWWDYGADDYAQLLKEAYQNEAIKAVVLNWNCMGASTDAMLSLKPALQKKNKPIISCVNSNAFSGAVYSYCFTDKVMAIDNMAEVGSIGVMSKIIDNTDAMAQYGYKVIEVTSKLSPWKNKATREAKAGNIELLQTEELDPWAEHFREVVRSNRPKLDETVEGILEGRTFYAKDALKNGLIDGIMPFDQVIEYAFNYDRNEKINSMFNK